MSNLEHFLIIGYIERQLYLQNNQDLGKFVKNNYKQKISPAMIYAIQNQIQNQIQDQLNLISNSLRAFSLKLTGNRDDADDLYQDTAVRIITNADKYHPGTNFKAWAVTIMRNIFINNYRKRVRRSMIVDQTPNNYYLNSGDQLVSNDGETNVSFGELLEMVDSLPEDFKKPFMMAYQGYKYDEIAEELDSPLGTIKSRIFFARKKLQKLYSSAMRERA